MATYPHISQLSHTLQWIVHVRLTHSRPTSSTMSDGTGTAYTSALTHKNMVASQYAVILLLLFNQAFVSYAGGSR